MRLLQHKTGLSPGKTVTDRSKSVLLLWFILLIGVTKLIGDGLLDIYLLCGFIIVLRLFYNICNEPRQNEVVAT